jgi:signal transduction histidine kinase
VPGEGGSFAEFIVSGLSPAEQRAIGPLPRQHGMLAELLRGGRAERLADITADPRFGGWLPRAHPPMGAFLGVPVLGGDQVLGIIFVAEKAVTADKTDAAGETGTGKAGGGEFSVRDEELLTLFAAHAAIALTNARLREDSRELSAAEERARLARELHDAVSQKLFAIRAQARAAAVLAGRDPARAGAAMTEVGELAGQAQAELRAVIEGLAPPALDGLAESLRRYAELAGRAHGVPVTVTDGPVPGGPVSGSPVTEGRVPPLDPATETMVYRVAQEALHNALRHSGGRRVTITLSGTARRVVLEVADDGQGFDPAAPHGPPGAGRGLGLDSMRQRAAAAGGTVAVRSAPGRGTTVRLEAPAGPR